MSDAPSDILVFGAGFGTRMAPLTETLPKPLVSVGGKPLIDHAIAHGRKRGLSIHVNGHYRAEQLAEHLADDIAFHHESPDILDTGGGLKSALREMSGQAVFTLNSDAVWAGPNPLDVLANSWTPDMAALLLLVPRLNTVGYSRPGNFSCVDGGKLERDPDGDIYTGAQIIGRSFVSATEGTAFSLNKVWDALMADGRAYGVLYPGHWADVGTPEAIPLAEAMLQDV